MLKRFVLAFAILGLAVASAENLSCHPFPTFQGRGQAVEGRGVSAQPREFETHHRPGQGIGGSSREGNYRGHEVRYHRNPLRRDRRQSVDQGNSPRRDEDHAWYLKSKPVFNRLRPSQPLPYRRRTPNRSRDRKGAVSVFGALDRRRIRRSSRDCESAGSRDSPESQPGTGRPDAPARCRWVRPVHAARRPPSRSPFLYRYPSPAPAPPGPREPIR